jgi:hypothetical protein
MTGGTAAAMLLRDRITRRENQWTELYDPNRFNLESVPNLVKDNADAAAPVVPGHAERRKSRLKMPSGPWQRRRVRIEWKCIHIYVYINSM